MSKFHYVVVSKDSNFQLGSVQAIEKLNTDARRISLVENNTKTLPDVYNSFLDESVDDFLVFMHADVKLDLESFEQHIIECQSKYDVIGLCGTSIMNVSQSPLNWWTGSNPTPQAKWGCVTHGELGNQTSYFSNHTPNALDHEVSCIDGLCIVFSKKAIESGMRFDPTFEFDFYDTDISFQCIMKYNMKLGVVVEKSLQHYSVGRSILTDEFLKHEVDFRKKWNLEIPENSPINLKFKKS